MSDDDTVIRGRDVGLIWRTVTVVAVIVSFCIGGILGAVAWAVRHDARLEAVEKWQAKHDREAARELWHRDSRPPAVKPAEPAT